MATLPPGAPRQRRAKGSGGTPRWSPRHNKYVVNVTISPGKRRPVYGATIHAAEQARDALLGKVDKGQPATNSRLTVARFLVDDYLPYFKLKTVAHKPGAKTSRKRGTYRDYESIVRVHLIPTLGAYSLEGGANSLTARVVQAKLINAKLKTGSSPRRVAMMRDVLRAALSYAYRMELVTQNVAKSLELDAAITSRVDKALTPEETEQLLAAAEGYRYWTFFKILVTCGMRLGEARALRWSDIDFPNRTLRIDKTIEELPGVPWSDGAPKAKSSYRTIPLIEPAIEALRREQDRQVFTRRKVGEDVWLDHGFVFSNDRGDVSSESSIRTQWQRTLKRAGLDDDHVLHDLRHTCASYLHMLGVPVRTINAIMGHSTLAMTLRYAHVFDASLDEARDKMGGLFSKMS